MLDAAVATLSETLRSVFVLRDIEGLSTAEVAEVLGLTETNVKVRLHRARLALREKLSAYFASDAVVRTVGDGEAVEGCMSIECKEHLGCLSDYVDGELDPELCAELERHMADCGDCRSWSTRCARL